MALPSPQRDNPESTWHHLMWNVRHLHFRRDKRNQAPILKLALFQVAAAGIPTSAFPNGGYDRSVAILAEELGINRKTAQEALTELERHDLITSRAKGPNMPRHRVANTSKIAAVARAQKADRDAFLRAHAEVGEDEPRVIWKCSEFYYDRSDFAVGHSMGFIDEPTDTPTDEPSGSPVGEPDSQTRQWNQTDQSDLND